MEEHRRHPRFSFDEEGWRAELTNEVTGEAIGQVVNLSLGGLMAFTNTGIVQDHLYQVRVTISDPAGHVDQYSAGMRALWCSDAGTPNTYWAGFEIIDISDADLSSLEALISSVASHVDTEPN